MSEKHRYNQYPKRYTYSLLPPDGLVDTLPKANQSVLFVNVTKPRTVTVQFYYRSLAPKIGGRTFVHVLDNGQEVDFPINAFIRAIGEQSFQPHAEVCEVNDRYCLICGAQGTDRQYYALVIHHTEHSTTTTQHCSVCLELLTRNLHRAGFGMD